MRLSKVKLTGVLLSGLGIFTVACGGTSSSSSSGGGLASSQVLHFPVFQDPKTWDPGSIDAEVDSELMQNVFDNLWRFDDKLNIVPVIATDIPTSGNGGISGNPVIFAYSRITAAGSRSPMTKISSGRAACGLAGSSCPSLPVRSNAPRG